MVMVVISMCFAYPSEVLHIIDGGVADTPTLVEVVEGGGVTQFQLLPLSGRGSSQHGVEDVKVSLHGILTHDSVLLEEVLRQRLRTNLRVYVQCICLHKLLSYISVKVLIPIFTNAYA